MEPLRDLVIAVIAFTLGIVAGYLIRGHIGKKVDGISGSAFILVVITTCWGLSVLFDILSPTYETPIAIHGLMGIIVGFFYKSKNEKNKQ